MAEEVGADPHHRDPRVDLPIAVHAGHAVGLVGDDRVLPGEPVCRMAELLVVDAVAVAGIQKPRVVRTGQKVRIRHNRRSYESHHGPPSENLRPGPRARKVTQAVTAATRKSRCADMTSRLAASSTPGRRSDGPS